MIFHTCIVQQIWLKAQIVPVIPPPNLKVWWPRLYIHRRKTGLLNHAYMGSSIRCCKQSSSLHLYLNLNSCTILIHGWLQHGVGYILPVWFPSLGTKIQITGRTHYGTILSLGDWLFCHPWTAQEFVTRLPSAKSLETPLVWKLDYPTAGIFIFSQIPRT